MAERGLRLDGEAHHLRHHATKVEWATVNPHASSSDELTIDDT
jgi:hypothetical protein